MNKSLFAVIAAVAVGLGGSLLLGSRPAPARPAVHVFAGVDRSLSAEPQLGAYAHCLADLATSLEDHDRLTLYRFDYNPYEFYDGPVPADIEHFKATLLQALRPAPPRRGTRPALFFKAVADRLDREGGEALVVMLSDGGNDDRSSDPMYRQAVQRLAERPGVRGMAVLGTLPAQRQELRDYLAPFGARLQLQGPEDISVGCLLDQISGK